MNLKAEARRIAKEALEESCDAEHAQDIVYNACVNHEIAVNPVEARKFCAKHNTTLGEGFLYDCRILIREGDTLDKVACRVVYATLYVAACECLNELLEQKEPNG